MQAETQVWIRVRGCARNCDLALGCARGCDLGAGVLDDMDAAYVLALLGAHIVLCKSSYDTIPYRKHKDHPPSHDRHPCQRKTARGNVFIQKASPRVLFYKHRAARQQGTASATEEAWDCVCELQVLVQAGTLYGLSMP